jgi:hypothetical protein
MIIMIVSTEPFEVRPERDSTTYWSRIVAFAALSFRAEQIAEFRRRPEEIAGVSLTASFLKHAEDQTIAALQTMQRALEAARLDPGSFADWGVVAAPVFLGRFALAHSLVRYRQEGAWGVAPHLIPHHSLHALPGTISQALKIHGPNFGINDGPGGESDAFLLATGLLAAGTLPGLWLVLTGNEREAIPSLDDPPATPPPCVAAVMALVSSVGPPKGARLAVRDAAEGRGTPAHLPEFYLPALLLPGARGKWRLSDSHWLDVDTRIRKEPA